MSQSACWMYNTLDQCAWVSFGYGSRFDQRTFWISHAGLMHLAKFNSTEYLFYGRMIATEELSLEAYLKLPIKKLRKEASVYIHIPGYPELEDIWFSDFLNELKTTQCLFDMASPSWEYFEWERPKYFGDNWIPIVRMLEMCKINDENVRNKDIPSFAYERAVPDTNSHHSENQPYNLISMGQPCDLDLDLDFTSRNIEDDLEDPTLIVSNYTYVQGPYDRQWLSFDTDYDHDCSYGRQSKELAYRGKKYYTPPGFFIFGGNVEYKGSWTTGTCPQQSWDFCIFGGTPIHYHFGKAQNPNKLQRYHR